MSGSGETRGEGAGCGSGVFQIPAPPPADRVKSSQMSVLKDVGHTGFFEDEIA